MNRSSSIIGYSLIVLLLAYFSIAKILEKNVERAITDVEQSISEIEGLRYEEVEVGLLSGDVKISGIDVDSFREFKNIHISNSQLSLNWKDRFRLLFSSEFPISRIQEIELVLNDVRMIEDGQKHWNVNQVQFNLIGEAENSFLAFLKNTIPGRPFKGTIQIREMSIVPNPAYTGFEMLDAYFLPAENLRIDLDFDPGLANLVADFIFRKADRSAIQAKLTLAFDRSKRYALIPKTAIVDFNADILLQGQRFDLNEDGNQLELQRLLSSGNIKASYQAIEQIAWIPQSAASRIKVRRATIYPSPQFMQKYGLFIQAFGFQQGFAELDSIHARLDFKNGMLDVSSTTLHGDWIQADLGLQADFLTNPTGETPILNGLLKVTKMSDPLQAGLRFIERQTGISLSDSDGQIAIPIDGTLQHPKLKGF